MARFVTAMLKTEVLPGELSVKEKLEVLLGYSSGWTPQEVLDRVPEEAPEWVLMVGTRVVPEEEPELLFGAMRCSLGATLECSPLESPPNQNQNHHKCLDATKTIYMGYQHSVRARWLNSIFTCLWSERESRSINLQKKNEANIQLS